MKKHPMHTYTKICMLTSTVRLYNKYFEYFCHQKIMYQKVTGIHHKCLVLTAMWWLIVTMLKTKIHIGIHLLLPILPALMMLIEYQTYQHSNIVWWKNQFASWTANAICRKDVCSSIKLLSNWKFILFLRIVNIYINSEDDNYLSNLE